MEEEEADETKKKLLFKKKIILHLRNDFVFRTKTTKKATMTEEILPIIKRSEDVTVAIITSANSHLFQLLYFTYMSFK